MKEVIEYDSNQLPLRFQYRSMLTTRHYVSMPPNPSKKSYTVYKLAWNLQNERVWYKTILEMPKDWDEVNAAHWFFMSNVTKLEWPVDPYQGKLCLSWSLWSRCYREFPWVIIDLVIEDFATCYLSLVCKRKSELKIQRIISDHKIGKIERKISLAKRGKTGNLERLESCQTEIVFERCFRKFHLCHSNRLFVFVRGLCAHGKQLYMNVNLRSRYYS